MTKRQVVGRVKAGVTVQRVVDAAFDVLEEGGIDQLSTRAIARRLEVSMNTVMWHIRTKDRLLDLMAESIVGEVDLGGLRGTWRQQATGLLQRLRAAMLRHRDGAAIVAGTFPAMPSTLAFGDRLVAILLTGCSTPKPAAWTAWNLFYFTLGLVQEEQRSPASLRDRIEPAFDEARFPSLNAVLGEFLSADYDARFTFGIGQILGSL